jgi:hypothetical protein
MQSWVGYKLVKVFVTFGLQSVALNDLLKEWSPDLYDGFSYMQTKKSEMKENALSIKQCILGTGTGFNLVHNKHATEKPISIQLSEELTKILEFSMPKQRKGFLTKA